MAAINLRQAAIVQSKIREAINSIHPDSNAQIGEFVSNVQGKIQEARADFREEFERRADLVRALFEIRAAVGEANARHGVNSRLAAIEEMKMMAAMEGYFQSHCDQMEVSEIEAQFAKAGREVGGYSQVRDSVRVPVFSRQEMREAEMRQNRMNVRIQEMQDEVLAINVAKKIELSDEAARVLAAEGIV